jgi:putative endonuclease
MTVTVYILKLVNGHYYTGITKDLVRRMLEHNHGKSKSTRHNLPVIIKHIEAFPDYKSARQKEVYIKHTGANKYLMTGKFI